MYGGVTRSVKSIGLDIKNPRGREVFGRLVAKSDAVLENFSRSAAHGLGLAYERLCEDRADIVLLSISGFGRTGPYADYVAFGGNVSSYQGMTTIRGYSHGAQPDYVAASHGAFALISALYARDQGAGGCWIDLSQAEAVAALLGPYYLAALATGEEPAWSTTANAPESFAGVFACRGADEWVAIEAATTEQQERLARVVGANGDLQGAVEGWVREHTPWQAQVLLQRAGVAANAVESGGHLYVDPQLRSRGSIRAVTHPDLGTIEYPGVPYRLSKTPGDVQHPAARLGQHTVETLTAIGGLSGADVDALVAEQVAWVA